MKPVDLSWRYWDTGAGDRDGTAAHVAGWCVYIFAFAALQYPALANVALGALALALAAHGRAAASALARSPAVWLLAAFVAVLALGFAFAWPPARHAEDFAASRRLLELWLFVPLAWWLGRSDRRAIVFLGIAAGSFVLARLWATDWSAPLSLPSGERIRLGFSSINHFAQYAATLVLGLLCFAPRAWRAASRLGPAPRIAARAGWCVLTVLAGYWVLASQSRGVWLALLVTLLAVAAALALRRGPRVLLAALAAMGVGVLILTAVAGGTVAHRLAADAATWQRLAAGDLTGLPFDAVGTRLHMLQFAAELWREAPWLGQGPGAVPALLEAAEPGLSGHGYKHLHNVLADSFARLGLVGGGLLQALFLWVFYAAWRAYRTGGRRLDLHLFTLGALFLSFLCNLTDLRLFGWDWRNYWLLLAAVACAPALGGDRREAAAGASSNRNPHFTAA